VLQKKSPGSFTRFRGTTESMRCEWLLGIAVVLGCGSSDETTPEGTVPTTGIAGSTGPSGSSGTATTSDEQVDSSSGEAPAQTSTSSSDGGIDTGSSSSGGGGPNPGCVGLPECQGFGGQMPDCSYMPALADAEYEYCSGPIVWVDTLHDNWHQITPESAAQPGRYWGFASLAFADGYDVRDSEAQLTDLVPGGEPDILVIANPGPAGPVLTAAEGDAVAAWVEAGGALLLVFDHPPFDEVSPVLDRFGLVREPIGADTQSSATFTITAGTLAAGVPATEGIGEITTFRGTSFEPMVTPPDGVTITPILTFGPGETAQVGGSTVSVTGLLQGAQVELGQGRVIVLAEAAMSTTQQSAAGNPIGMHQTPDNEQFVRNVLHWLDG